MSLDPGVRKFLVGYNPRGEVVYIGEGAHLELKRMLLEVDGITDPKERYLKWKRIKDYVSELHWKTISYLVENYDIIILPDFRVSEMVKGKRLPRIVKRLLNMFSFYKFKERLAFKCEMYKRELIIVDESYTSCTCTRCGKIVRLKGNEVFNCPSCGLSVDRDVCGSRNIFLKNIRLRCP